MEQYRTGVSVEIEDALSTEKVWTVLIEKVQKPEKFSSLISEVITKQSVDGKG